MRAFVHRWWRWLVALTFAGLLVNVLVQDGWWPFLVVLGAVVGCAATWWVVLGGIGYAVAGHAKKESAQIAAGNHPMKELAR